MLINKRKLLDYFLVVLLVMSSGVPYLVSPILNILQFSILSLVFILRKKVFNISFILFFTLLFIITLLQGLDFNFFPIITNLGLYILVFNAYFTVKVLENKFVDYFINVMYYIAIISLMFYSVFLISPFIGNFFIHNIVPLFNSLNFAHSVHQTIIIYNLSHIDIFRNSGPFWEPGAFAGYLMIAFMFNVIFGKKIMNKKNIILFLTIITTLSTTAYLSLFIFFTFVYYKYIKNILMKNIIVIFILLSGIIAYSTLDFLGAKIESRLEGFHKANVLETRNSGRFVSILRDMRDFKGHELAGVGRSNKTRYNASISPTQKNVVRSNGMSDIFVRYGVIFFIILIYSLYTSICIFISKKNKNNKNKLICIGIFMVLMLDLWSEVYFSYPIYWSLLFLRYINIKKEEEEIV